jgi:ssDNA-binding Zn-finger/Zn-ribbon topoisomerase 1
MTSTVVTCPSCGSSMMPRHNRTTGEPFWACSRYPACRGTRPASTEITSAPAVPKSTRRRRYRLSDGRREPRNVPDVIELLVARRLGRNLGIWEGFAVQIVAIGAVLALVWAFAASGAFMWTMTQFANWYASQVHFAAAPVATPSPNP